MPFELPPLPYAEDALEPHMSKKTIEFHYGKHHKGYVDTLNTLVEGTKFDGKGLVDIVIEASEAPGAEKIFNNAAQVWNHTFFWEGMDAASSAPKLKEASGIAGLVEQSFGGFDQFRQTFIEEATGRFGSGWCWLVYSNDKLRVTSTPNAESPLLGHNIPLLTCDVWEHAYYLDYQNQRKAFVEAFLDNLVDWETVEARLADAVDVRGAATAMRRTV